MYTSVIQIHIKFPSIKVIPIYAPTSNIRVSISPSRQCVVKLLHIYNVIEEKWFLTVLVICISFFAFEAEQIFMFSFHFIFCERFIFFAHFYTGLLCFFLIKF